MQNDRQRCKINSERFLSISCGFFKLRRKNGGGGDEANLALDIVKSNKNVAFSNLGHLELLSRFFEFLCWYNQGFHALDSLKFVKYLR